MSDDILPAHALGTGTLSDSLGVDQCTSTESSNTALHDEWSTELGEEERSRQDSANNKQPVGRRCHPPQSHMTEILSAGGTSRLQLL